MGADARELASCCCAGWCIEDEEGDWLVAEVVERDMRRTLLTGQCDNAQVFLTDQEMNGRLKE